MKVHILGVIIFLQLSNLQAKRKYKGVSSSEESIENILYYKDCNSRQHRRKNAPSTPLRATIQPPPKPPECKMFCTMCCGDTCVDNSQMIKSNQQPMMNERSMLSNVMPPIPKPRPDPLIQPPIRGNKKKFKEPLLPPIGGRRDYGFTREDIKGLIAQDEDIKRILKDLVKVTMQKVDLVEMINARRNQVDTIDVPEDNTENED